jgi:hypothetical protein
VITNAVSELSAVDAPLRFPGNDRVGAFATLLMREKAENPLQSRTHGSKLVTYGNEELISGLEVGTERERERAGHRRKVISSVVQVPVSLYFSSIRARSSVG